MNTMDEVIKALECCELGSMYSMCESCPYAGIGNCNVEIQEDALHYLKKYREEYKALVKAINEAIDVEMKYYHMIEELERNSPLTWDELTQMEGKPVWVVPEAEKGYWFVIEFFNNNPYYGGDRVCFTNDVILNRCDLGKTWQVYRKERDETN